MNDQMLTCRQEGMRCQTLLLLAKIRRVLSDYRGPEAASAQLTDELIDDLLVACSWDDLREVALVADRNEGGTVVRLARWEGVITAELNRLLPPSPRPSSAVLAEADLKVVAEFGPRLSDYASELQVDWDERRTPVARGGRLLGLVTAVAPDRSRALATVDGRTYTISRRDVRRLGLTQGTWVSFNVVCSLRCAAVEYLG